MKQEQDQFNLDTARGFAYGAVFGVVAWTVVYFAARFFIEAMA